MKRNLRVTAVLLILSLLLSLSACVTPPDPSTGPSVNPTTAAPTTAPPTTHVPNEGLVLYMAARETLEKQENVGMVVSVTETMTMPAEQIVTQISQDISYVGRGTDHFEALVQDTTGNSYGSLQNKEIFSGGKVYITSYGANYLSDLTAEEYVARYLPVILIDENLYTSCEYTVGDYSTEVRFQDATAPESWIPENAVIVEASGTAVINPQGELKKYTYDVTYSLLGAKIRKEISVIIAAPQVKNVNEPTDSSDYLPVPHPDVLKALDIAFNRTMSATSISCSVMNKTLSNAGAVVFTDISGIETYDGGSYMAQVDFSREYTDLQTMETGGFTQQEFFRNNRYSVSSNGGTPSTDPSVSQKMMSEYIYDEVISGWIDYSFMTDCEVKDLGDILLFEFKGSEELAGLIEDDISYEFFEDKDFLDNLASKYVTQMMDFYIAIDKNFGLPTAAGFTYTGYHVIDGVQYPIAREVSSSIYLASNESHKAITGNAMPDTGDAESPTPLFYRVTGANGEELWLLGTIHVGDERTGALPDEILNALYASDALAVECIPDALKDEVKDPAVAQEYADAYYYTDGTTARDHITDDALYELSWDLMKANGFCNYLLPYMKTSMWENTISGNFARLSYSFSSDKGVDNRLQKLAQSHNIPIRQVESNIFQIKMMTGWSDALAESLLASAVAYDLQTYTAEIMELYAMWCEGDEVALKEYLTQDTSDMTAEELALWSEYHKAMETDRNKHMAETAIEYLESGETVFYAVGLAHVIAEDGLVNALRDAGYTVEPVTYK